MDITLTPEQRDVIEHAVGAGRVAGAEEAVRQALELWIERERRRSEILSVVDSAEAALARGEGTMIASDAELAALVADIQRRGLERLAP